MAQDLLLFQPDLYKTMSKKYVKATLNLRRDEVPPIRISQRYLYGLLRRRLQDYLEDYIKNTPDEEQCSKEFITLKTYYNKCQARGLKNGSFASVDQMVCAHPATANFHTPLTISLHRFELL